MKRIGLDVRMIDSSGIGTTVRQMINHFSAEQRAKLLLYGRPDWENKTGCKAKSIPYPVYGIRQHWSYAQFLKREPISFFHMPHYDVPLGYKGPFVATVYDLIHYLFPQYSTKPFTKQYSWLLLRHVARNAKKIVAISEWTKRDLVRVFPESEPKITVLPLAADASFRPAGEEEINQALSLYGLKKGYLLYVGNLRESKNTPRLLRAYAGLSQQNPDVPPLVLIGRNFLRKGLLESFGPKVRHLGDVSFNQLNAFYSGASLFVFPSLYEGFGLPPLESMACGTPVLVSKAASLPEVCGDAAAYTDAGSEEGIGRAIKDLLGDPKRRDVLRQKGLEHVKKYSWDNFSKGMWRVYEEMA